MPVGSIGIHSDCFSLQLAGTGLTAILQVLFVLRLKACKSHLLTKYPLVTIPRSRIRSTGILTPTLCSGT